VGNLLQVKEIKKKTWDEFVHPIAVCEECGVLTVADIRTFPDAVIAEFADWHKLAFLILRRDKDGRRYEIDGEGSSDLLKLLERAGEVWRVPGVDIRKDVSDVCLYIRQRLGEI
jgi:hypothetical protein